MKGGRSGQVFQMKRVMCKGPVLVSLADLRNFE